nr:hypothetical protein GCM10020092_032690 [Actinoplanes digitatis]
MLAHQGIREQGAVHPVPAAAQRRVQRQFLVPGDVGDESGLVGRDRPDPQRCRAVGADPGGDLDDRVGRQVWQGAVVADVDRVDPVLVQAVQGGDEPDRGLGVVRAAALAEQGGLGGQRRVAVHVQQPRLDLRDPRAAGRCAACGAHHAVVAVVVGEVVRRDAAQRGQHRLVDLHLGGQLGAVRVEEFGEPVDAVHVRGPLPGQVVEADVVEHHRGRVDTEVSGKATLEADRHVAQPDGAVARIEQRPGDDADRVGEVDDPRARAGPLPDPRGDVEDDRHRTQSLGEPARPPVVSCPTQPQSSGNVSSLIRAA